MKIILLQDVEHLGRIGDVKEVANGYGRNYLIPHSLATLATPAQLKQIGRYQAQRAKVDAQRLTESRSMADKLRGLEVVIPARVGDQGRLFGSVTNQDVAAALKEQHGIELDRREIALDDPIRSLGAHTVTVHLGGQVNSELRVSVVDQVAATA